MHFLSLAGVALRTMFHPESQSATIPDSADFHFLSIWRNTSASLTGTVPFTKA